MANIYKHFYSLFNQEKERLDHKIAVRQDAPRQSLQTPLTVAAALLGLGVSSLMLGSSEPRQKLEDHPMCGITTGGQAECYFDCEIFASSTTGRIITNLECLKDCFGNQIGVQGQKQESCLNSLIDDVITNGICNVPDYISPSYEGIYNTNETCGFGSAIFLGTCSIKTEELLVDEDCINEVLEQPSFIQNTLIRLILTSCSFTVSEQYLNLSQSLSGYSRPDYEYYDYEYGEYGEYGDYDGSGSGSGSGDNSNYEDKELKQRYTKLKNRYAPTQIVVQVLQSNLRTQLNFENTRHRYPWVCSLRTRGALQEHLCAVTLLSIPPKPTVVIGAAHCTYICKNEEEIAIPVCCCSDGVQNCADDKTKCGDNPEVYEMTSRDVEIICGEWETGDTPSEFSGEEYNVLLPIKEIVRHPNFNQTYGVGPLAGSDIAVFKVDDSSIQNKTSSLRLRPICLPKSEKNKSVKQTGILPAWSKPPPIHFIEQQAIGYLRIYRDFFKLWHYKVDIETCRDPLFNNLLNLTFQKPSNSFYPPGTVCAKEFSRTCFTSGESGSPLMVREKTRPMRFFAEGLLSFVKGCDVFTFVATDIANTRWQLNQLTENPNTFTKLSCFLPWVAEQYGMEYKVSNPTDPACFVGQGDPLDGEKICTVTPNTLLDAFTGEVECIFPYYYDGKRYDECVLFDISGLLNPVFRCPSRNITTKIDGINSFPASSLTDGLCPTVTDDIDSNSELDPDIQTCSDFARRAPFSQCKNNCPGVRAFGLIGGGAALAFLGVTSAIQTLVPAAFGVGAIGVAGLGGNMVAQMMCFTPYCRTISGRCCLLVTSLVGGLQCPDTC